MDHEDAATQVIEDASRTVLPDAKANVIARVKRDFARQGHCDASLIAVIEKAIEARLAQWSLEEKREIWEGLIESGVMIAPEAEFDDYPEDSIDLALEPELLCLITEMLAPSNQKSSDPIENGADSEA